jgi:predicted ArsR family transcriptional regulator
MSLIIDENPTRKKIIMMLKKSEHLTVREMSQEMGITSMAVRQHLMSLEKRGIIYYTTRKYGIGRPVFLYKLTDKAQDFFPKSYAPFVTEVLGIIESLDGRKKVRRIFQERKDRILRERQAAIGNKGTTEDRVRSLVALLDRDGYMVELNEMKDHLELREYNCPIHNLVGDYPEACSMELELYRQLFSEKVERIECQRDGASSCTYLIPN